LDDFAKGVTIQDMKKRHPMNTLYAVLNDSRKKSADAGDLGKLDNTSTSSSPPDSARVLHDWEPFDPCDGESSSSSVTKARSRQARRQTRKSPKEVDAVGRQDFITWEELQLLEEEDVEANEHEASTFDWFGATSMPPFAQGLLGDFATALSGILCCRKEGRVTPRAVPEAFPVMTSCDQSMNG